MWYHNSNTHTHTQTMEHQKDGRSSLEEEEGEKEEWTLSSLRGRMKQSASVRLSCFVLPLLTLSFPTSLSPNTPPHSFSLSDLHLHSPKCYNYVSLSFGRH